MRQLCKGRSDSLAHPSFFPFQHLVKAQLSTDKSAWVIWTNAVCTPGIQAPARTRRQPNQDLKERLAKCEELLSQYSEASKVSIDSSTSAAPVAGQYPYSNNIVSDGGNRTNTWSPTLNISKEDGRKLFMDGYFLGQSVQGSEAFRIPFLLHCLVPSNSN